MTVNVTPSPGLNVLIHVIRQFCIIDSLRLVISGRLLRLTERCIFTISSFLCSVINWTCESLLFMLNQNILMCVFSEIGTQQYSHYGLCMDIYIIFNTYFNYRNTKRLHDRKNIRAAIFNSYDEAFYVIVTFPRGVTRNKKSGSRGGRRPSLISC